MRAQGFQGGRLCVTTPSEGTYFILFYFIRFANYWRGHSNSMTLINPGPYNLVPRAFPSKNVWGGKNPCIGWSRVQPKYSL